MLHPSIIDNSIDNSINIKSFHITTTYQQPFDTVAILFALCTAVSGNCNAQFMTHFVGPKLMIKDILCMVILEIVAL